MADRIGRTVPIGDLQQEECFRFTDGKGRWGYPHDADFFYGQSLQHPQREDFRRWCAQLVGAGLLRNSGWGFITLSDTQHPAARGATVQVVPRWADRVEGVRAKDLRPGDVVTGCGTDRSPTYTPWDFYLVKGVSAGPVGATFLTFHNGRGEDVRDADQFFRVYRRPGAGASPARGTEFPHTCPRCGGAAYVGFLRVEHRDTTTCGARP